MIRSAPRPLIAYTLATALVIGVVVSLATGTWWFLLVAVLVHGVATMLVLVTLSGRLAQQDKPDPVTEARLAEEGGGSGRGSDEQARPEDKPHEPPFD